MATPKALRHLRSPVPQSEFNAKTLATRLVEPAKWVNLRWRRFATKKDLFFSSASARLTPDGGKTGCLYLASDERTAFLELYGDKIHLAHEAGANPIIEANDFLERVFIDVDLPAITLVDLTTGAGLQSIDIDLGTLFAADPKYPRAFAQSVFDHPAKVDGFLYESRHSKERCAVVWSDHRPLLAEIAWGNVRSLGDRVTHLVGDIADVFGSRVQIAS